jgi:hypothetical protein
VQTPLQSEFNRIILNFAKFYKIWRDRWGPIFLFWLNFQTLVTTHWSTHVGVGCLSLQIHITALALGRQQYQSWVVSHDPCNKIDTSWSTEVGACIAHRKASPSTYRGPWYWGSQEPTIDIQKYLLVLHTSWTNINVQKKLQSMLPAPHQCTEPGGLYHTPPSAAGTETPSCKVWKQWVIIQCINK